MKQGIQLRDALPGRLRLTDLPYPRFWGGVMRFFKTFEVLLFKVLQWLELYRGQKSVFGIPSLALPNFTSLQAAVFNGTQEEVLGYRPRRLLHRLLKGVPDLEMFERFRFQLSLSENYIRSVEGSSEARGFIHLQLPWQLPWKTSNMAWLRIEPMGVETLFGRIRLGDYEVISCPVFFLNDSVKSIIISDIDDTIKDSRIAETMSFREVLRGLFKGHFYTYRAIAGMAELYQSLAAQGALIVYVTSTPYQLSPFLLKFLKDGGFPEGPVYPRWLGYNRFGHKWRTIHRVLSNLGNKPAMLIGDSGEQDLQIYRRICENPAFGNRVSRVLIRHVPGTPIQKALNDREIFYRSIEELKVECEKGLATATG